MREGSQECSWIASVDQAWQLRIAQFGNDQMSQQQQQICRRYFSALLYLPCTQQLHMHKAEHSRKADLDVASGSVCHHSDEQLSIVLVGSVSLVFSLLSSDSQKSHPTRPFSDCRNLSAGASGFCVINFSLGFPSSFCQGENFLNVQNKRQVSQNFRSPHSSH